MTDLKKLKAAAAEVERVLLSAYGAAGNVELRALLDLVDALPADAVLVPRATLERVREAAERSEGALLTLSPWKLQDCWCDEPDRGGKEAHRGPCLKARWAIKAVRAALTTLDGLLKGGGE
jgi:hypothetical protein